MGNCFRARKSCMYMNILSSETPRRDSGDIGTQPYSHQHRNKWNIYKLLVTREQKHILGNREHLNRRNTLREQEGNTRNILWEGGNMSPLNPLRKRSSHLTINETWYQQTYEKIQNRKTKKLNKRISSSLPLPEDVKPTHC